MKHTRIIFISIGCLFMLNSTGQQITFQQKILPFDTVQWGRNFFGSDVKIADGVLFIGDSGNDLDANGMNNIENSGAVGMYEMNAGLWEYKDKLVANKRSMGGVFGDRIETLDSNLFVTSMNANEFGASNFIIKSNVGSVWYFKKDAQGNWVQKQSVMSSDREPFDKFGSSFAVHEDEMFVGASGQDYDSIGNNFKNGAGAVYYFKKSANGLWEEKQKITSPERMLHDEGFGRFSLLYDGEQLFIGSSNNVDSSGNNPLSKAGALFVYEKNNQNQWTSVQKITASHRDSIDAFGSVANFRIDEYLFVTSQNGMDENGINYLRDAGACFVFKKNASNRWKEVQKIVSPYRKTSDGWGLRESIHAYEDFLLIGAYRDWTNENNQDSITDAGSAYLYKRNNSGSYEFIRKLVAEPRIIGQQFGFSLFMDSTHIIISSIDERYGMLQRGVVNYFSFVDTSGSGGGGGPTGVNLYEDINVNLFPNPTSGSFTITFNRDIGESSLAIIDNKGTIITRRTITGKTVIVSESLTSGVYILQLQLASQIIQRKLVIN